MRCLSMAMFVFLSLSVEAAMKKHANSQIAGALSRPDLRRYVSIIHGEKYKHKSEGEIARMTPAQRVDEWVNEQVHHRYDLSDDHGEIIKKYILRDGLKALPRTIETLDEYDPTRSRESKGRIGERFDACLLIFIYIDRQAVRLRASEEGRLAMDALERAINRMHAVGARRKEHQEWKWVPHGRFEGAVAYLQEAKGINDTDEVIRNTLRLAHRIQLSNGELLELSNFLVARYPEYPSWSDRDFIKINEGGKPKRGLIMKKMQPFYEAYLEFKKTKR